MIKSQKLFRVTREDVENHYCSLHFHKNNIAYDSNYHYNISPNGKIALCDLMRKPMLQLNNFLKFLNAIEATVAFSSVL